MRNVNKLITHPQDHHSDQELPDERSSRQQCWHHWGVPGDQTALTEKREEIHIFLLLPGLEDYWHISQFLAGLTLFTQNQTCRL